MMIDLEELLNGTPTWEQVVEFWKDDGEFCKEYYLVEAIEKWLLTEEQRKIMFDNRLSIEKMLNGRYPCSDEMYKVVHGIYDAWNAKLGFKKFGS
jgi:hypothetical protein